MLLTVQDLSFILPSGKPLFQHLHFSIGKGGITGLVGDNGTGKSTLLKILAGELPPADGAVLHEGQVYYVPQHFGQYNDLTVAEALGIASRLDALQAILEGNTDARYFEELQDDWDLEERCRQAFSDWGLQDIGLLHCFSSLSGGEKTRTFLAGIDIWQPDLVLMDEPTNHLDTSTRERLYDWVTTNKTQVWLASHDRQLLQYCDHICELTSAGLKMYGGGFDFYLEKKAEEEAAFQQRLSDAEKSVRVAKRKQQETFEQQQNDTNRGVKKTQTNNIPKGLINTLRNRAELSSAKLKSVHEKKLTGLREELDKLREQELLQGNMRTDFGDARLHAGKILVKADHINVSFRENSTLWSQPLSFQINSGDRVAITGDNGSGKSTLISLIMGNRPPAQGELYLADCQRVLLDQEYSLVDRNKTVLQQLESFNDGGLLDHELKVRLNRFLFDQHTWHKPCSVLSGGETLRLALCCIMVRNNTPDMIILDEPANNLDLRNLSILTRAMAAYNGTLVIISHDIVFLEEVGITQEIHLQ
ncbi:ATP-binding cassette domain-containing protein [Chitinophaga pendula]|uniref:ABC-F family ATP-binding cassette domain-containing protein n=1 Tax=Chitinophaga TaxID=79328 RepID=UPI000BAF38D5|nr:MULTISPECIES: ABC-F family ATP-binding cassette domain-containing protein [Chitinophaga]ASZ11244.1 ABC transporter ATP-binding protein [Chitinophaga sp. MD30]UCJ05758.1 ATP-binding cassette domain-containing protein [Chitinophaga pendula]